MILFHSSYVVTLKEIGTLINLVRNIDPDAFVTVNNVHEVLGEGFRRRILFTTIIEEFTNSFLVFNYRINVS